MLFCVILGGLVISRAQGLLCKCTRIDAAQIIPCFSNGTCRADEYGACYTRVHAEDAEDGHLYGCLDPERMLNGEPAGGMPLVCRDTAVLQAEFMTTCCNDKDECNKALDPTLGTARPDTSTEDNGKPTKTVIIAVTIGGTALVICVVSIGIALYCIKKKHDNPTFEVDPESDPMINEGTTAATSLNELMEEFSCSGSGSGLPLLMQRTIARQIELHELVGKGRFGNVFRGTWRGDNVAVKMFHSREEQSWFREAEVYQTAMLRHENVLGFIAADNRDGGKWTQLWLITDFHEQGSLFDYLHTNHVDISTMFRLIHSTVCGIAHLHMEIIGSDMQGPNKQFAPGSSQNARKPAIAHRDLKSKNILVKRSGVCCIADLGLAVKHDSEKNLIDMPKMNHRVGTIRYMPPEVLDETIQPQQFESYKQGDIYSLGLVIWEIARRLNVNGHVEEYMLPYEEQAPSDPTVEEMRAVVVHDKLRPTVPTKWANISALKLLIKLMKECWHENPGARLTALRVKKTVSAMAETEGIIV